MRKWILAAIGVAWLAAGSAQAQHAGHPAAHGANGLSPYAGWQNREIKSFSEEQLGDLRAARGMSLALSAELNGYPGPTHVLDLAEHLDLSANQRAATEALLADMKREAKTAGDKLIAAERAVDAVFTGGAPTDSALDRTVAAAAEARGRLRAVHLRYHLRMAEVLTPAQVELYNQRRGYRD